jgi:diaminobutyrate-2-oxoglutarate transaminase
VAGREALTYFDDDVLMDQVHARAEVMVAALTTLADDLDAGFDVRGRGMIQGLDVGDGALAKAVTTACFDDGLLIGPCGTGGRVLKLIPPLTIDDDDLVEGLRILDAAVRRAI